MEVAVNKFQCCKMSFERVFFEWQLLHILKFLMCSYKKKAIRSLWPHTHLFFSWRNGKKFFTIDKECWQNIIMRHIYSIQGQLYPAHAVNETNQTRISIRKKQQRTTRKKKKKKKLRNRKMSQKLSTCLAQKFSMLLLASERMMLTPMYDTLVFICHCLVLRCIYVMNTYFCSHRWNHFVRLEFFFLRLLHLTICYICIASDTLESELFFCFLVIVVAVVAIAFFNFPHVAHHTNWTDIKWLKAGNHKTYLT